MSEPGQDGGEKSHEPTPRKLDEARRQGDIPRSSDLNFAAALLGLALACAGAGAFAVSRAGAALAGWIGDAAASAGPLEIATLRAGFAGLMAEVLVALAPVLGLPVLLVVASVAGQRGFVFAGPKIAPKLSRIDPVAVAKQKFGRAGLFEFAKSALKLIAISLAVGLFLYAGRGPLIGSLQAAPAQIGGLMGRMLLDFLWLSVAISGVIAALDYLFQVSDHRLRQSMTHKELRDEFRQTEGDPHVKQARRQRGHDIATNRMLAEVPKADVVLVNPTHYAVALRWDRASGRAPVCVARGQDEVAARIREAAQAAGVPIRRDPATARALHATVALGAEIRPEHYRAVAAAIRFAEEMRARARARGR
jgi:flagellar biosynthesis protein FlhB